MAQDEKLGAQLDWIPVYIDRLLSSQRWRLMEDFQRGWYWSLIVESVRSDRPGYLRLNRDLWRLAGARSEQFFKAKNAVVLACFESREIQGETWVFSGRLVRTLEEQSKKYRSKLDSFDGKEVKNKASPTLTSVVLSSRTSKEEVRKKNPEKNCPRCAGSGRMPLKAHPGTVIDCFCTTAKVEA